MYLVDTNVISELRKGTRANPGVQAFWLEAQSTPLYLAVQTIGEIRRGIENLYRRGDRVQATLLLNWLELIETQFSGQILNFDHEAAHVWGKLMAPNHHNPVDKQIAAIALMHALTVVTRNTADFADTGIKVLNPFT